MHNRSTKMAVWVPFDEFTHFHYNFAIEVKHAILSRFGQLIIKKKKKKTY